MAKQELNQRIQDSIHHSRRRRWYNFFWGKMLIAALFIVLVIFVLFSFIVGFHYKKIISGELITEVADSVKQEARLDLLHNGGDPRQGPKDATITLVVFEDFQCPFCAAAQPFFKKLMNKYAGDIRFIYKDYPLISIHPEAQRAAEAAQCANEQGKFWEFHDILFANQERFSEAYYRTVAKSLSLNINQYNVCYSTGKYRRLILNDVELGITLNVSGTPTFFLNGELIAEGYSPELDDQIYQAIDFIRSL